jgi:hypothetical protein
VCIGIKLFLIIVCFSNDIGLLLKGSIEFDNDFVIVLGWGIRISKGSESGDNDKDG